MHILSQLKNLLRKKPKIIVVLGQTSTGKSDLAVEIAKIIKGEIISADSRQVYVGMDLGSGKISQEEMQGVPHYMLDVANPAKETFSVVDFQRAGDLVIQDILEKGKIPIICGGTGFYIDALVFGNKLSSVPENKKLRQDLSKKTAQELAKIFEEEFPREAKKIDLKNPVRIIRALEICRAIGKIPKIKQEKKYTILFIGLELEKEILHNRIHTRIIKRLDRGMLKEAKRLLDLGVSHKKLQSFGLEYKWMSRQLLGKISLEEMIDGLSRETKKFAKRQKTWFKKNKDIFWFHSIDDKEKVFEKVKIFLEK